MATTPPPGQDFRRDRLEKLLAHVDFAGNKAELGRALGYASGAYVRQMIDGDRVITEKTVAAIHSIRGGRYRGWFDSAPHDDSAPPWPLERISPAAWDALSERQKGAIEDAAVRALQTLTSDDDSILSETSLQAIKDRIARRRAEAQAAQTRTPTLKGKK